MMRGANPLRQKVEWVLCVPMSERSMLRSVLWGGHSQVCERAFVHRVLRVWCSVGVICRDARVISRAAGLDCRGSRVFCPGEEVNYRGAMVFCRSVVWISRAFGVEWRRSRL